MKKFDFTIQDEMGIHARPAGMLTKEAKNYQSTITMEKDGKSVNVLKLMAVMAMGIKCGETVTVTVEGEDEEVAAAAMEEFFKANF
ncbi:MAG: HPr family phosphocarrier protein [Lachnospiraceae bacterium]|nr:HPr family phosphocarrier protein [Lachnospiraceae bacterium]